MKVCTQCGEEKPESDYYWSNTTQRYITECKSCNNARSRENGKRHYKENQEKIREKNKQWYEKNKEERQKQLVKYNKEHPEIIAAIQARYYERNKEARRARSDAWRKSNLGKDVIASSTRRARKREAGGTWTLEEWNALKEKYGFMCLCCKQEEPDIKLVADHVVPLARGGSNYIENIQPLCVSCNARKHAKTVDYRLSTG